MGGEITVADVIERLLETGEKETSVGIVLILTAVEGVKVTLALILADLPTRSFSLDPSYNVDQVIPELALYQRSPALQIIRNII